ncbi:hypothetical protein COEREDRAFT_13706 [Coemansia reversa NRRL 1564]|uniref:Uncharacterized protein n=1 Tax=Coemansia reversa (strain ATCC 12441 / NRRL 1564) TaxID=763665 RepID=A0A2G5BHZ2_COERN|nr:hypothetical protein COEREDRAFT_13706 [Coemansia reversa NRRL 1564]|eukprot:PIA18640.1 hypothetical protein COEREDRAFT_13706 [Coemansia reversa NRRL 1564]
MKVAVSLFTLFVVTLADLNGGYITANYPAPAPSMSVPVYTAPQAPSNTGMPSENPSNGYKTSVTNGSNYKSNVDYDNGHKHKHKHKNDDYDNDYKAGHGAHGHKNDDYGAKDRDYDKDDKDKVEDGNYNIKNNDYKTNSGKYKNKGGQESRHKHRPEAHTSSITAPSYSAASATGYQTYN